MKKLAVTAVMGWFALCTGCGEVEVFGQKIVDFDNETKNEEYTYKYSINGCSTGRHTFDSKKKYCKALLNHKKNNFCAAETRRRTYERRCD